VKQSLTDFLSGMHWHNNQSRLYWMTKMSVTARLSSTVPTIRFQNTHKLLRSHVPSPPDLDRESNNRSEKAGSVPRKVKRINGLMSFRGNFGAAKHLKLNRWLGKTETDRVNPQSELQEPTC
jgi:hypothetical protein